jgi:hypothetical protein
MPNNVEKKISYEVASADPKPQNRPTVSEIFDEFFGIQNQHRPKPDWIDEDTKNYINETLKLAMADDDKDFFMKYLTPYYSKEELEGKSVIELNELLQGILDRRILKRVGKV